MPRGLIHEAECKPSLWVTRKPQLPPCGDYTSCCKENPAAVEGTLQCAIAVRMIGQRLLDCCLVLRLQIWGGPAPCSSEPHPGHGVVLQDRL